MIPAIQKWKLEAQGIKLLIVHPEIQLASYRSGQQLKLSPVVFNPNLEVLINTKQEKNVPRVKRNKQN